jgi:hypothetical protein
MSDLKERLLALKGTVPSEVVSIPGVGEVEVRGLTAAGRDEWEQTHVATARARTVQQHPGRTSGSQCLYQRWPAMLLTPLDVERDWGVAGHQLLIDLYEVACQPERDLAITDRGRRLEGNSESAR